MSDSLKIIKSCISQKDINIKTVLVEIANNCKEQRISILSILDSEYSLKCLELRENKDSKAHFLHSLFMANSLQRTGFENTDNDIMSEYLNQLVVKEFPDDTVLQNLHKLRTLFEIDAFDQRCIKEMIPLNNLSYHKLAYIRTEGYNANNTPKQK